MLDIALIAWIFLVILTFFTIHRCQIDKRGHRHLISANGIVVITFSLYFLVPALNPIITDGNFYWAESYSSKFIVLIVMCSLIWALTMYTLGYLLSLKSNNPSISHITQKSNIQDSNQIAINTSLLLIATGILMKLIAISVGGGIEDTIIRMSRGVADTQDITESTSIVGQIRNLSGISEAGATYLLLESMRTKKNKWRGLIIFCIVTGFALISTGKRLYILWPMLVAIAGFSWYRHTLQPKHFFLLLPIGLGFGFITLMFRIYAPLYFAGGLSNLDLTDVPWAKGSLWLFYFNSLEFSFFELTAAAFVDNEVIDRIFGGSFLAFYRPHIEPFFYIIPRALWTDKPESFMDISHAMTTLIFQSEFTSKSYGIATGLTGTSYILGGFPGFTLSFFVLGLICRRIDKKYIGRYSTGEQVLSMQIVWFAFWLMVVFHIFRQGTIGWVFMITIIQQLGVLIGFFVISTVSRLSTRHLNKINYA